MQAYNVFVRCFVLIKMELELILLNKPIYGGIYTLCQKTTTGGLPRPARLQGARDPAGEALPRSSHPPQMHRSPPMPQNLPMQQSLLMPEMQASKAIPTAATAARLAEILNPNRRQAPQDLPLPGPRVLHIPRAKARLRQIPRNPDKAPRAGAASRPRSLSSQPLKHVPRVVRPLPREIPY